MNEQTAITVTAPAPEGAPCEWCRGGAAEVEVEVVPAKFVTRGENKGQVLNHATVIRACRPCAERIEAEKERQREAEEKLREERLAARRLARKKARR